MTPDEAIAFLSAHQPFAPTDQLTQATLDQMDAARQALTDSPDARCIPLWLNAFGDGDAHGVYALVGDCLTPHEPALVLPELVKALRSGARSVRYWSVQIATLFPDDALIDALLERIDHDDEEIRRDALAALDLIGSTESERAVDRVTGADPALKAYLDDLRGGP